MSVWDVVDRGWLFRLKIKWPNVLSLCLFLREPGSVCWYLQFGGPGFPGRQLTSTLRSKVSCVRLGTGIAQSWLDTTPPVLQGTTRYFPFVLLLSPCKPFSDTWCYRLRIAVAKYRSQVSPSSPHPRFCVKAGSEKHLFNLHWPPGSKDFQWQRSWATTSVKGF